MLFFKPKVYTVFSRGCQLSTQQQKTFFLLKFRGQPAARADMAAAFARRLSCVVGIVVASYGLYVETKMEQAEHAIEDWKAQSSADPGFGGAKPDEYVRTVW